MATAVKTAHETQQKEDVYEETRTVEADLTFSKQRMAFMAAVAEQGI